MVREEVKKALLSVSENELAKIGNVADRLLTDRSAFAGGGQPRMHRSGRGTEFLDYQVYLPGTDVRMVDWRASARSRHMLVRRYQDEASSEWYVCLDRSASMGIDGGVKWMLSVQIAAAFLFLLLRRSNRAGLITFNEKVDALCPPGRARKQYCRVVDLLSNTLPRIQGGGSVLETCAPHMGRRRSAIFISDFLTEDAMVSGLSRVLRLGGNVHAIQVTSERDRTVEFVGRGLVRDVESGKRLIIDVQSDGTHAAERMRHLQSVLTEHCRRNAIILTECDGRQPWQVVVVRHLGRISGKRA